MSARELIAEARSPRWYDRPKPLVVALASALEEALDENDRLRAERDRYCFLAMGRLPENNAEPTP